MTQFKKEGIAAKIADGKRVEWSEEDLESSSEAQALKKLEQIALRFARDRPQPAVPDLPFGGKWGPITLIEPIGRGSFGEVFRAYDASLDRDVALKLFRDLQEVRPFGAQYVAEARRLARVRHPQVLAIYGADFYEGSAGIWSELLLGDTLESLLKSGNNLRWSRLLPLAANLASAVAAVHQNALIHGDIKAANVMLDPERGAVLMDFGAGGEKESGTGGSQGTPLVMAPEHLAGAPTTQAGDIYSLGVLFYSLTTGHYPHEAETREELAEKVGQEKVDFGQFSGSPKLWRSLIRRMLALEASDRPDHQEVVQALEDLRTLPRRRAKRMGLLTAAALLLGITVVSTVGTVVARRAQERSAKAEQEAGEVNKVLTTMFAAAAPLRGGPEVRIVDILDQAHKDLDRRTDLDPNVLCRLRTTLGQTYFTLGLSQKAEEILIKNRDLEGVSPDFRLFSAFVHMGVLESLGRRDEALEMGRTILLEVQDLEVSTTRIRFILQVMANVESAMGLFEEAQQHLNQSRDLGREDPDDYTDASEFMHQGNLYLAQSRFKEGEAAYKSAMEAFERAGDEGRYRTMTLEFMLATALTQQGRLSDASIRFGNLVEEMEDYLGQTHPSLMKTYVNYANVLMELGQYERALELNRKAEAIALANQGPSHPDLDSVRIGQANILKSLSRNDEAEMVYVALNRDLLEKHGASHPLTLINQLNLAEFFLETRRPLEADKLLQPAEARSFESLGATHQITLEIQELLGWSLAKQERASEGLAILEGVLETKLEVLGGDNPFTITARVRMADALVAMGRLSEARQEYNIALTDRLRVLGEDHPSSIELTEILANL